MRSELKATIPVECWVAFAEVGWYERRPELAIVCAAARDASQRITPELLLDVLPGLQEAGARNIIAWCASLGLCDKHGALTDRGESAAETQEVPVPEQGVFALWLVDHPLLGRRALHAERVSPRREGSFEQIAPIARAPARRAPVRSVVEPTSRFEVRSFAPKDDLPEGVPREVDARCEVRWSIDFARREERWVLRGHLDGRTALRHEGERSGDDIERILAAWAAGPLRAHGRWKADTRRLARSFAGLDVAAQESFTSRVPLGDVEVPGRGLWKDVTLDDVPIEPATPDDAAQWANARLARRLEGTPAYRTRDAVRALFANLTEGTPLAAHRPTPPNHDTLLAQYRERPEVFWSLAAPVDLTPQPLDAAAQEGDR